MKVIILRNNLLVALAVVEKAISQNVNLPILKNIFFGVKENKLVLASTNLELGIKSYFSGKIIEEGEITIPFGIFSNIVRNLTTDRVQLESKGTSLIIKSDNYEASVNTQGAEDFPIIPTLQTNEKNVVFKNSLFRDVIAKTIVATQYSEIRPEISGLCIRKSSDSLKFVATDSFRLAERVLRKEEYRTESDDFEFIVPFKTAQEILKIIGPEGEVSVYFDANQVLFKTENQEVVSRLINGNFPDYQAIIPKESKTEIVVNRMELLNAVKLTSVFTSRANDVILKSGENGKFLEIYAGDSQVGENRSLIPVKMRGDNFSTIFNWRYLLDGLKTLETEEVVLGMTAPDRPMMIKGVNLSNFFYLVMPIRV